MGFLDRLRGKPTPADFAAILIRAITHAGETRELRYEPDEGRILRLEGGETTGVINLQNMYGIYLAKPRGERPAYLKQCVRSALTGSRELPEDFDAARPDLRPKIWSRAGIENQKLRARLDGMGDGPDPPGVPLGEHLLVCVAFDWPESTQSISAGDLERWGVTLYEALEAAREGLAESTGGHAQVGDNVYVFVEGDSYDAGRLLIVDRVRDFETAGRPVAVVPNRDTAALTGEDDADGLAVLAALAAGRIDDHYALSGVPLVLEGETWEDWSPPPGHPCAGAFRDLETRSLWPAYRDQKELLDRLSEREGAGPFVATFTALKKARAEGESLLSYCVWGEGVESLLPATEKIVFMRAGATEAAAVGTWDRVREVAGHLMEETEHYPKRFRVRAFPDADALAAIGPGPL